MQELLKIGGNLEAEAVEIGYQGEEGAIMIAPSTTTTTITTTMISTEDEAGEVETCIAEADMTTTALMDIEEGGQMTEETMHNEDIHLLGVLLIGAHLIGDHL